MKTALRFLVMERRSRNSRRSGLRVTGENFDTPMLEIFGGAFALLMVLFIIINLLNSPTSIARAENVDEGEYKISWGQEGEGFVVIAYPARLWIIETQQSIPRDTICDTDSPFVKYAFEKYSAENKQIIFTILDDAVKTTSIARNCLRAMFPSIPISIGWIVANSEFLKAVNLNEIPSYVGDFIKE